MNMLTKLPWVHSGPHGRIVCMCLLICCILIPKIKGYIWVMKETPTVWYRDQINAALCSPSLFSKWAAGCWRTCPGFSGGPMLYNVTTKHDVGRFKICTLSKVAEHFWQKITTSADKDISHKITCKSTLQLMIIEGDKCWEDSWVTEISLQLSCWEVVLTFQESLLHTQHKKDALQGQHSGSEFPWIVMA